MPMSNGPSPDLVDDPVANLREKRSTLVDEVEARVRRVGQLNREVAALDIVFGLFGGGQPKINTFPQRRKQTGRMVLACMREFGRPMTSMEVAEHILFALKISAEDQEFISLVKLRIRSSMANFQRKGLLVAHKNADRRNLWEIV